MKKTVVWSLAVILAALGGMFFLLNKNYYEEEYLIAADGIDNVMVEADSWTTVLEGSENGTIKIVVSGKGKSKEMIPVNIEQENGTLKVIQKKEVRDFISNFTFGKENKITIYVPKDTIESLQIESNNGDIYIKEAKFEDINAISKSGEIRASNMWNNSNISLETKSGDIRIQYQERINNLAISAVSLKEEVTMRLDNMEEQKRTKGEYQGKAGEGEYQLNINTINGYITIQ